MNLSITPPSHIQVAIDLPASKSISNRVLVINALRHRPRPLLGLAQCDDTLAVQQVLAQPQTARINVGAAGTAMRFLTAYLATQEGREVVIDGSERMRARPIGVLVDALRHMGASITCEEREGYPPLRIAGHRLHGGQVAIDGGVSSQFITALLLIGPAVGGLRLEITGQLVSRPYVDMTVALMREFGAQVEWQANVINVQPHYRCEASPQPFIVEADWSAASYWLALQALVPGASIKLHGLLPPERSLQGDSRFATVLRQMANPYGCCATYADLSGTPDIAQTLTVLLCLLGRPFRLTGLRTLRIKETDRLEALRVELLKLGYVVKVCGDDALEWQMRRVPPAARPAIDTYHDHRMAMAFAIASVAFPGLIINNAQVVSKSYPDFWQHLASAGFKLEQVGE